MKVQPCEECGTDIVACDNSVYLDYPAVPYDDLRASWTLMTLGSMTLATNGGPSLQGTAHTLHEHQPNEGG